MCRIRERLANENALVPKDLDYSSLGNQRLFERMKKLGDWLVVAVQDGGSILKTKPTANILYTTEQRVELVKALRVVDEVIVYRDVDKILPEVEFDVFAVGEDQVHPRFQRAFDWCARNGKEVVRLPRTPGICSSDIKKELGKTGNEASPTQDLL